MASKDKTLIPVGGVAAKLEKINDTDYKVVSPGSGSRLFCFLPLPKETNYPVHVNGYFAVHSSRTHIYDTSSSDPGDQRTTWNEALLEDAVARSYCILLEDLTSLCPNSDCYTVWPTHVSIGDIGILQHLTRSLYKCICFDNGDECRQI